MGSLAVKRGAVASVGRLNGGHRRVMRSNAVRRTHATNDDYDDIYIYLYLFLFIYLFIYLIKKKLLYIFF